MGWDRDGRRYLVERGRGVDPKLAFPESNRRCRGESLDARQSIKERFGLRRVMVRISKVGINI